MSILKKSSVLAADYPNITAINSRFQPLPQEYDYLTQEFKDSLIEDCQYFLLEISFKYKLVLFGKCPKY